jgi:hypothetical protein
VLLFLLTVHSLGRRCYWFCLRCVRFASGAFLFTDQTVDGTWCRFGRRLLGYGMYPLFSIKTYIYIYIYIYLVIGNSLHGLDVPPYTSLPRCSPSSTASRGYSSPTNHPPHSILTTHSCHTSPVILRYHRYPLGRNSTRPLPPPPLHLPTTYPRPPPPPTPRGRGLAPPPAPHPPPCIIALSPYHSHPRPLLQPDATTYTT